MWYNINVLKEAAMELAEVIKLKLCTNESTDIAFYETAYQYMLACGEISQYVFKHDFEINSVLLSRVLYKRIRETFGLKSQMVQSAIRTVTARYQAVNTQMKKKPYRFTLDKKHYTFNRDMTWLQKPIAFKRPQCDLVRNRDYSFVHNKIDGHIQLSINTLGKRVVCDFVLPEYMQKFFDGSWSLGTAKLVELNDIWYLHISATKNIDEFERSDVKHVVGIDRGLRFLASVYDEQQKTQFFSGKAILRKRDKFDTVRAQLQAKGTRSAKRRLASISGRENRWMSDVNHCISKALVRRYGPGTLFVLEDLTGVSFEEENMHGAKQTHDLRNWSFYDLETKLAYKAAESGSCVLKVSPQYTSQRCPRCGAVVKENRDHDKHVYKCRQCGYTSNDDRIGAMNIYMLGTFWVSGNENPQFDKVKLIEPAESVSVK